MRDAWRRLEKLEAQVNAIFPEPEQTPAEEAAEESAWKALVGPWLMRMAKGMAEEHRPLLKAWIEDFGQPCGHTPCPLPAGLRQHIDKLRALKGDESRQPAVGLPAAVVEIYLSSDCLHCRPHGDCEDCGTPVPVSFFFMQSQQVWHFPHCPLCGGVTGWHAWDIKHKSEGYASLKPYGERT